MRQRSVGLQKDLSVIFEGVKMPNEASERAPAGGEAKGETGEYVRLDPIALFEEIARIKRRRASFWGRLKAIFAGHPGRTRK